MRTLHSGPTQTATVPTSRISGFPPVEQAFAELAETLLRPHTAALPVDVVVDEVGYTVTCNIPGVTEDEVNIEFSGGKLTISTAETDEQATGRKLMSELRSSHGRSRRLNLGDKVDTENISAELSSGVLTVKAPLAESAKPRTIKVSASRAK